MSAQCACMQIRACVCGGGGGGGVGRGYSPPQRAPIHPPTHPRALSLSSFPPWPLALFLSRTISCSGARPPCQAASANPCRSTPGRGRRASTFLVQSRRYIGKSQSGRPPKRTQRPPHQPAAAASARPAAASPSTCQPRAAHGIAHSLAQHHRRHSPSQDSIPASQPSHATMTIDYLRPSLPPSLPPRALEAPAAQLQRRVGAPGPGVGAAQRRVALVEQRPEVLRPKRRAIQPRWVSKPLAFAGKLQPRRPNHQPFWTHLPRLPAQLGVVVVPVHGVLRPVIVHLAPPAEQKVTAAEGGVGVA
jgi:hypothetical protein